MKATSLKISLLLFLAFAGDLQAQPVKLQPGEKLRYGAYYNWHFIWIRSGEVNFNFSSVKTAGTERWKVQADGHTFKAYDLLYKIRDTLQTECQPGTFEPIQARQTMNHGGSRADYRYRLAPATKKIFSEVKRFDQPFFRDTLELAPGIRDMLATAYWFRTIDFSKLETGRKIPFIMLVDNEVHHIYYRYLGKETIKNRNNQSFNCHKFSILLLQGDFFPAGEYLKVWIDDSPHRFPVMVETKILVGSVKAMLETAEVNGVPIYRDDK